MKWKQKDLALKIDMDGKLTKTMKLKKNNFDKGEINVLSLLTISRPLIQ